MFETNGWVLVSGGAGFIGGHIAEKLLGMGVRVRILDNFATGSRALVEQLRSKGTLELADVVGLGGGGGCAHAAALSSTRAAGARARAAASLHPPTHRVQ